MSNNYRGTIGDQQARMGAYSNRISGNPILSAWYNSSTYAKIGLILSGLTAGSLVLYVFIK
ncbi:MAG: hypothetical protein J4428_03985 [Candidatus Aenigmarchaeota archaeon]|nr:hypothetical protein [Candidatus Aenigmarchaeota archaeon]